MASVFTKIIAREIASYIVAENELFLAFLDVNPLQIGHTLIVPKKEIDYIFDVEDDLLEKMILFSKEVAIKIKGAYPCNRIGLTVIGLEVPHAHIHLIPINKMQDMNFANPKLTLSKDNFIEIQQKIVIQ
jgi:histidine triad (HIT) family protein